MVRRLEEYRKIQPTKELPLQRDFPNCRKYKHCCDESWKGKLENVKDIPKPKIIAEISQNNTLKKPNGFDRF